MLMNPESITLISFGFFEKRLLEMVMGEVEHEFSIPVRTKEGFLDLSEFYDAARKQYNGNLLLSEIDARFGADNRKTLGVFNVDLFIPIFTYIFGQAYLNGRSGVASIYRLKNERYGLKPDQGLFLNRIRKEVIHELGHSLGLIHCSNTLCVMRSSTYVEDIDQKSHRLCPECRTTFESLR